MIVKFDEQNQTAKVSLRAEEILQKLQEDEKNGIKDIKSLWRPEYAGEIFLHLEFYKKSKCFFLIHS